MTAVDTRSDRQQYLVVITSCESQIDGGNEKMAEDAKSFLRTLLPYTKDWKVRYDRWHKEQSLANVS